MTYNKSNLLKEFLFFLLIIIILITSVTDTEAARRKKKRTYNPNATKQQAIEIIRSSSESVSQLAGIEPKIDLSNETKQLLENDGEILNEEGDYGEVIEELEKEDDVTVSFEEFNNLWMKYIDEKSNSQYTSYGIKKTELMDFIMKKLGTPYKFGATSGSSTFDCSSFTQSLFLNVANIQLPRVAREQINIGKKVNRKDLEFGDLVFFLTYSRKFASHVGVYLGDNLFAHASSRYGVTVSSLESSYYKKNFIGGRRLTTKDMIALSVNQRNILNAERKR